MSVLYRQMSRARAEAAFVEFLAERPVAMQRVRDALAGDGIDPDVLLDGSVASLIPMWEWLCARLTSKDDAPSQPVEVLPTWSRYSQPEESTLSEASIQLVDGLISYFGQVVLDTRPICADMQFFSCSLPRSAHAPTLPPCPSQGRAGRRVSCRRTWPRSGRRSAPRRPCASPSGWR